MRHHRDRSGRNRLKGTTTVQNSIRRAWKRGEKPCRAVPELFHSPDGPPELACVRREREAQARALCFGCPARLRCLDVAVAGGEVHGVWGGADEAALRAARKEGWTRPRRLLVDVHLAWPRGEEIVVPHVLARRLRSGCPGRYAELTGRGLAAQLRAYGVPAVAMSEHGMRRVRRADVAVALGALGMTTLPGLAPERPGRAVAGPRRLVGRRVA